MKKNNSIVYFFFFLGALINFNSACSQSADKVRKLTSDPEESKDSEYFMYVSSGMEQDNLGIGVYKWNPESGISALVYNDSSISVSSYLEINALSKTLYSVGKEGISAHKINPTTGQLTFLNKVENVGRGPCHISISESGGFLFIGYYSSGSLAVFEIRENNEVGAMLDYKSHVGSGINPERQEAPHVHMVLPVPDSDLILVPDLGIDSVKVYKVDVTGKLQEVAKEHNGVIEAGGGPRHVAIHPSGRYTYVLHELSGKVSGFTFDSGRGFTGNIGTWNTLKEGFDGFNKSADIHISKDGRFLYVSNRGPNDIAVFSIDPTSGVLSKIANLDCGGDWPRAFTIDPSGWFLIVANKNSNQLSIMKINQETGLFKKISENKTSLSPQAIRFLKTE